MAQSQSIVSSVPKHHLGWKLGTRPMKWRCDTRRPVIQSCTVAPALQTEPTLSRPSRLALDIRLFDLRGKEMRYPPPCYLDIQRMTRHLFSDHDFLLKLTWKRCCKHGLLSDSILTSQDNIPVATMSSVADMKPGYGIPAL